MASLRLAAFGFLLISLEVSPVICGCTGENLTPRAPRTPSSRLDHTAAGATAVIYTAVSDAVACLDKCLDYETFVCEAFNYNTSQAICEILNKDTGTELALEEGWDFYDVECVSNVPEATQGPSNMTSVKADDMGRDLNSAYDYLRANPEYAAMIGMGVIILLLFITAVIILCCYTSKGVSNTDKYREDH